MTRVIKTLIIQTVCGGEREGGRDREVDSDTGSLMTTFFQNRRSLRLQPAEHFVSQADTQTDRKTNRQTGSHTLARKPRMKNLETGINGDKTVNR